MVKAHFDSIAQRQPQAIAVVDGATRLSYEELRLRSGQLARCLVEEAGVRRGDTVAICLPNCWEWIAAFVATMGIGAVLVPVHSQWRGPELTWIAGRLGFRALITDSELATAWSEAGATPPALILVNDPALQAHMCAAEEPMPASPVGAGERATIFATSGSTGRPRLVPITNANLMGWVKCGAAGLGMQPGSRSLGTVPYHYSGAFMNGMLVPLLTGATTVVLKAFTPAAAEAAIAQERVEIMFGPPFLFSMMLENNVRRESLASLRTAVSGGAPMAPETVRQLEDKLGLRVQQGYGASEAGIIAIQPREIPFQPGLVGRPQVTIDLHVEDESGKRLAAGEIGEVVVGGPSVFAGYLDEPELNQRSFRNGFFRTGDLGRLDESGNLFICGRLKHVLNLGGVKVDPVEIEHAVMELPAVRDCMVHGVQDELQGELAAATIALRPGHKLTRQQVVTHCRQRLAEFKIPRQIEFVKNIAVDATGKRPQAWDKHDE